MLTNLAGVNVANVGHQHWWHFLESGNGLS